MLLCVASLSSGLLFESVCVCVCMRVSISLRGSESCIMHVWSPRVFHMQISHISLSPKAFTWAHYSLRLLDKTHLSSIAGWLATSFFSGDIMPTGCCGCWLARRHEWPVCSGWVKASVAHRNTHVRVFTVRFGVSTFTPETDFAQWGWVCWSLCPLCCRHHDLTEPQELYAVYENPLDNV